MKKNDYLCSRWALIIVSACFTIISSLFYTKSFFTLLHTALKGWKFSFALFFTLPSVRENTFRLFFTIILSKDVLAANSKNIYEKILRKQTKIVISLN